MHCELLNSGTTLTVSSSIQDEMTNECDRFIDMFIKDSHNVPPLDFEIDMATCITDAFEMGKISPNICFDHYVLGNCISIYLLFIFSF